jgi:hypothetical protein
VEPTSSRATKTSPRLVLGRSTAVAAIAATPPAAGARVLSLGCARDKGGEETELRVGERNRARTAGGLAWPGGRWQHPALASVRGRGEEELLESDAGEGVSPRRVREGELRLGWAWDGMSNEVWLGQSGPLNLSEREKEEIRVDLVHSFERLASFGCIFLGARRIVHDCGG